MLVVYLVLCFLGMAKTKSAGISKCPTRAKPSVKAPIYSPATANPSRKTRGQARKNVLNLNEKPSQTASLIASATPSLGGDDPQKTSSSVHSSPKSSSSKEVSASRSDGSGGAKPSTEVSP